MMEGKQSLAGIMKMTMTVKIKFSKAIPLRSVTRSTDTDNFLEGQEGIDAGTVERVAESHAPSVEPSTSQLEVPLRVLPRSWREGDYLVSRYPDGSAGMRLGAQEEIITPRTLFAEVREEHKAIPFVLLVRARLLGSLPWSPWYLSWRGWRI